MVGDQVKYNTACDLFAVLKAKEFYKTIGFKEIAIIYGDTENSYRKTTRLINRFRYQEIGGTPYRTLQDNTEQEGAQLTEYKDKISYQTLQKNGFDPDGVYNGGKVYGDNPPGTLSYTVVTDAAKKVKDEFDLDELLDNPVLYEDPQKSVSIAIDDVNVKRQEETREKGKGDEERKRKYVHNTVVYVEKEKQKYYGRK